MKSIKTYLYSALLLTVVGFASCNKSNESVEFDDVLDSGEGVLALSCDMALDDSSTRAVMSTEEAEARLEDYILKIYSVSDSGTTELIRYYKPAYEIPDALYLTSGNYKATLAMQVDAEPTYATRDSEEFTYEGEQSFTIEKDKQTDVTITCGVINSIVRMQLDASSFVTNNGTTSAEYTFDGATGSIVINPNGDATDDNVVVKNIVGYVTAEPCTTAAEVMKSADGYMLEYNFIEGSGVSSSETNVDFVCEDGYYMLCEDSSALYYAISFEYSDKTDVDFETYTTYGKISSVKSKTIYTLGMTCSQADTGSVGLSILLTNSEYDENENDFSFSPQPTISGDGVDAAFNYIDGDIVYDLDALISMSSVTVVRDGVSYTLMTGGEVASSEIGSLSVADDKLSATLTLNNSFYTGFNAGGDNSYTITVVDEKNSVGSASPTAKLTGVVNSISGVDYWNNTGSFTAYVAESDAQSAVFYSRRAGDSEWRELTMPNALSQGNNTVNIEAVWSEAFKNAGGNTCYELLFGASATATYECKLEVDGTQRGGIVSITAGGTQNLIPYASMDVSGLSCFSNSNSSTLYWGSGNNSMSSGLCSYSSLYDGCALLDAKDGVTLVNIAPGNLFLGQFDLSGTNGTVSFGQKFTWTSRPLTFKCRYKATVGTVDTAYHSGAPLSKGDQDISTIFFAIVDWSSRHGVTSGSSKVSGVWDPESNTSVDEGAIIGYAMLDISATTSSMREVEIPVYYYDKVTNPSSSNISIVVSCSTSKYGDYLTGCATNQMWVDNFEFGY